MAKKKQIKPDYLGWTEEDYKAISWCIHNGIGMVTIPYSGHDFRVEITIKGKTSFSPVFDKSIVLEKQREYYYYYYNKYNKEKV